jgi:hypothetical protein
MKANQYFTGTCANSAIAAAAKQKAPHIPGPADLGFTAPCDTFSIDAVSRESSYYRRSFSLLRSHRTCRSELERGPGEIRTRIL